MSEPWKLPKHRFNPLAHLNINDENVFADIAGLAEALILTEGKDPYFEDTGRDLVKLLILHLVATKGGSATLPEMRKLLTTLATRDEAAAEVMADLLDSPYPFISQPLTFAFPSL